MPEFTLYKFEMNAHSRKIKAVQRSIKLKGNLFLKHTFSTKLATVKWFTYIISGKNDVYPFCLYKGNYIMCTVSI